MRSARTAAIGALVGALLLFGDWQQVWAQIVPLSPLPTVEIDEFDTPSNLSTPVYAVLEANDRYYIGGNFSTTGGQTQPFLAAIDVATGQLVPEFRPEVVSDNEEIERRGVKALAISPDGADLYIGGFFSHVDGVQRSRIAKLDAITGELDPTFDPGASAVVDAIETDGTSVWVGGAFQTLGGVLSPHLGKLDAVTGVPDTSWTATTDSDVHDLDIVDQTLYLAGNFTRVGQHTVAGDGTANFDSAAVVDRAARVSLPSGAVERDPNGVDAAWNPPAQHRVFEIDAHPDGSLIYLAGAGSKVDGGNSLRAIDATTGDEIWRRVNAGDYQAIAVTEDAVYGGTHGNWVFIDPAGNLCESSGCFEESPGVFVDNPNAVRRNKLSAYDPATGELLEWNPGTNSTWGVWALEVGPSGLLVGGDFTETGGVSQSHFAVYGGTNAPAAQPNITNACDGACTFDQTLDLPVEVLAAEAANANSNQLDVVLPAEAQQNDLAVAVVTLSDGVAVSPPAGWSQIGAASVRDIQSQVFSRRVGPGEPGTVVSFDLSAQSKADVAVSVFRSPNRTPEVLAVEPMTEGLLRFSHDAPRVTFSGEAAVLHYWSDRTGDTTRIIAPLDEIALISSTDDGGGHITSTLALHPATQIDSALESTAVADSATSNAISWTIAVGPGIDQPAVELNAADGTVERVVHLSLDGLGSGFVNNDLTPNLMRLISEGTSTLNARSDGNFTQTMPNHFSQLSGRPVAGNGGHGVDFNQWDPDVNTNTVHDEAGEYVASVFDVVHDNGLRTAAFVSKEKLEMINLSWGANGAPDNVGPNNGTNKIDLFERNAPTLLMASVIDELETNSPAYTFVHLRTPDQTGHANTWGSPEYQLGVQQTDALVGELISAISWDPSLAGSTAIIITADHGGPIGETSHIDATNPQNFTIPFIYWGPGVAPGADMYTNEAGVRSDPGPGQVPNNGGASNEPVRDHDAGNLALELLELPAIADSHYNLGADAAPAVDTTDPSMSFSSLTTATGTATPLTDGTTIGASTNTISGTASDDLSGVNRVRVRIQRVGTSTYWDGNAFTNGAKWNEASLSNNNETWTLSDVGFINPADYLIQVAVYDNAGNIAWAFENPSATITVTSGVTDTTPPVVTFTSDLTQQIGLVDIEGGVTDDISGVDRVRVLIRHQQTNEYWNGNSWVTSWRWNIPTLNGDDTWTLPAVDLDRVGTYVVLIWAWDNADNQAHWTQNPNPTITVQNPVTDTTPPVVTFTTELSQQVGSVDLAGGVTDDLSGVNRMRVLVRHQQTGEYWNGNSWQAGWRWNIPTLNANDTWTLPNVDFDRVGTYAIQLWAWDNDENRAFWTDNPNPTITVSNGVPDTTPPVITFTSALNQQPGLIDLEGGVTDDNSGVDRVRVRLRNLETGEYWNGTSWQTNWIWILATLNGNDTWTLPSVDLTETGTYALRLWAWDNVDNEADSLVNPKPTIVVG